MSVISDEALAETLQVGGVALGLVKRVLAIQQMNELYRRCAAETGGDFAAAILRSLGIRLIVKDDAFAALTPGQPMAIICNHPFGLLDGLILIKLLGERLRRFKIVANYMLSGLDTLRDHFVFVNSFDDAGDKRSNVANVRAILRLAENGSSLVIFPAGDVSYFRLRRLRVEDREWDAASIKLIRRLHLPILPVHIEGRNSIAYQIMNGIHHKLGLLRLPRELLNKRGHSVRIAAGEPFRLRPRDMSDDIPRLSGMLKGRVYGLRGQAW
jgi:putative hemolysin